MVGTLFTLNCTPSAANPPVDTVSIEVDGSPVTNSDTVTVTDSVLTIPSVQRSHSGNYSCTATNTRGSAVIYQDLLVTSGGGERAEVNFMQSVVQRLYAILQQAPKPWTSLPRIRLIFSTLCWKIVY